ncbi:MAG: MotA/TolQ/ExbB proton channel family protein [Candidatus Adiutrix sp.]|jgi:biopolymer transport protein ExbB/TolQ|nr:MotA/TolQ/ExbB proton channel family protein [Candidatus Adiutrix sp.]
MAADDTTNPTESPARLTADSASPPAGPETAAATAAPTPEAAGPEAAPGGAETETRLTASVAANDPTAGNISIKEMFLHADPVVQGVMLLLLLASVASWVVIFEKTYLLKKASRNILLFKRAAAKTDQAVELKSFPSLTAPIVKAGQAESRDLAGHETRCDYRERVERAMRSELAGLMDRLGGGAMFLATVGAVSPFVGLFGTVWGIMHSFVGIAATGETTLAVVAPGIAEALFATAMGLAAAIPAVIAYNKITGVLKKITKEALTGVGLVGNRLARAHFSRAANGGATWTPES